MLAIDTEQECEHELQDKIETKLFLDAHRDRGLLQVGIITLSE